MPFLRVFRTISTVFDIIYRILFCGVLILEGIIMWANEPLNDLDKIVITCSFAYTIIVALNLLPVLWYKLKLQRGNRHEP